jgi:hypothetical protein
MSTMRLGWIHPLAIHAPAKPQWVTDMDRAIRQTKTWLAADHSTPRPTGDYFEQALLEREMHHP